MRKKIKRNTQVFEIECDVKNNTMNIGWEDNKKDETKTHQKI